MYVHEVYERSDLEAPRLRQERSDLSSANFLHSVHGAQRSVRAQRTFCILNSSPTSYFQKAVAQYLENGYSVALTELMSDYYSDNYLIDIELTSKP